MDLQRLIFRSFKLKGLSLTAEASDALKSVLLREDEIEGSLNYIVSEILERIHKHEITNSLIDVETIKSVVAFLSSSEEDLAHESLQLFDAFQSPKLIFNEYNKTFKIDPKPKYTLLGGPESRADMYRERILLAQQRLLRSGLFALKGMSQKSSHSSNSTNARLKDVHELSMIESLLGSEGIKVLLGILTQPEEGSWYLEDLSGLIRLDLTQARTFQMLFTEGSIVVVEGLLIGNGVFKVQVMGFPPAEVREVSMKAIGISDIFGSGMGSQSIQCMRELEVASTQTMMVILSDIQLDKPQVAEKLQQVFAGFESNGGVDPLFILMGSFISKPLSRTMGGRDIMKSVFATLTQLITSCPRIAANAKFLIVPGPLDGGSSIALPRRPIPSLYVSMMQEKIKNVTFASNPCRLRCFTQEIVLFREDLLKKMQRHLIISPLHSNGLDDPNVPNTKLPDITQQFVESLLNQSHLYPLPLHAKPIHWELDYTLRLFPLPNLLILGDHADQFCYEYHQCQVVNPGSFSSDYSFVVYRTCNKSVEFSRVT